MEINYESAGADDWYYIINEDGTRGPSFTNTGQIGKEMWIEFQKWLAEGNEPLPQKTMSDEERKDFLLDDLRQQRNYKLKESDALMLSDRTGYNIESVKEYRQSLRDLPSKHTTIKELESINWPTKPEY